MAKIQNFKIDLVNILYKIYINKKKNYSNSEFFKNKKKRNEKKIIKQNFNSILIKFSKSLSLTKLRYFKMGKLNPSYLLGYNELIIFSFYLFNKKKISEFYRCRSQHWFTFNFF